MMLHNAQTNEAESMQSNGQVHTDIGDQSELYGQTFLDLDEIKRDQALFAMLENDAQINEAHVQTNCTPKKTRKRVATEPASTWTSSRCAPHAHRMRFNSNTSTTIS